MPGVPMKFAEHKLHVRSDVKPVRQPLRRLSEEKRRVVGEDIAWLLAAGFIMEVFFPEWLANPVLVLKKNKQWQMCIDYTSLNKALPQGPVCFAENRSGDRLHSRMRAVELLRCLFRISPDQAKPG